VTTVKVIASADITIEKEENCGEKGVTHWVWSTPARGDSECFNSFAEAAQDAEESFQYYAEGF
jgi:hypothetical protein